MAPAPGNPVVATIKKAYRFFNESLQLVSKEVEVQFTPAVDAAEAMQRLGNDEKLILKALNAQLQRLAISDARKSALAGGLSKKILLNVIKPFRSMPPWNSMVDENLTGPAKSEARKKQTEALLELVKSNSVMLEAVKAASANSDDEDDDDGEDSAE